MHKLPPSLGAVDRYLAELKFAAACGVLSPDHLPALRGLVTSMTLRKRWAKVDPKVRSAKASELGRKSAASRRARRIALSRATP